MPAFVHPRYPGMLTYEVIHHHLFQGRNRGMSSQKWKKPHYVPREIIQQTKVIIHLSTGRASEYGLKTVAFLPAKGSTEAPTEDPFHYSQSSCVPIFLSRKPDTLKQYDRSIWLVRRVIEQTRPKGCSFDSFPYLFDFEKKARSLNPSKTTQANPCHVYKTIFIIYIKLTLHVIDFYCPCAVWKTWGLHGNFF